MGKAKAVHMRLLDIKAATARRGCKRVKHYDDIKHGLMTRPVRIGARFSRWPEHEVEAIVRARIAGVGDEGVRALVQRLHEQRVEAPRE